MISKEQRERRKAGIFSSDVPRIMKGGGVRLCLEKMGVLEEEEYESRELDIGSKAEALVLDAYEERVGTRLLQRSPDTLLHPEMQWLGAHLDAIEQPRRIVEAKTVGCWMKQEWGDGGDECPERVIWQVQEQMVVTGAEEAAVPVCFINEDSLKDLFLGKPPHITLYVVPADEELQFRLVKAAKHVWDCVVTKTQPLPEVPTDVNILYRRDNGLAVDATEEVFAVYRQLMEARAAKSAAEKKESDLKLQIKAYMQEAAILQYDNHTLATWKKTADIVKLDEGALAAAYPKIYKQFLKPTDGSRRFLPKEIRTL